MASALRTVTWSQRAIRLKLLCRQLGHRPQDLLQGQHLRYPADLRHGLDGRRSFACAASRSFRFQTVAAVARHMGHTPEYAGSVQPALGRAALLARFDNSGGSEGLPYYGESAHLAGDGSGCLLAATPAAYRTIPAAGEIPAIVRRPEISARKTDSIGETGVARSIGGRSRARDQQSPHRHAWIFGTTQRVQPAGRGTNPGGTDWGASPSHDHAGCEPAHFCSAGSSPVVESRHQLRSANGGSPARSPTRSAGKLSAP